MPPLGKPLTNDGPACRVCGCTEHNACAMLAIIQVGKRKARETTIGCSWVKTEASTPPLCSACSGTPQDLAEAMVRGRRMLKQSGGLGVGLLIKINEAALARYRARQKRG